MVQFDVCCKRDSKSLIVMTIFHVNVILGEPGAAKNSFPGSSPTRLFDPDNEVGAVVGTRRTGKPLWRHS